MKRAGSENSNDRESSSTIKVIQATPCWALVSATGFSPFFQLLHHGNLTSSIFENNLSTIFSKASNLSSSVTFCNLLSKVSPLESFFTQASFSSVSMTPMVICGSAASSCANRWIIGFNCWHGGHLKRDRQIVSESNSRWYMINKSSKQKKGLYNHLREEIQDSEVNGDCMSVAFAWDCHRVRLEHTILQTTSSIRFCLITQDTIQIKCLFQAQSLW